MGKTSKGIIIMAEAKKGDGDNKVCNTTIALSVATRDLLQKVSFPSERYDDTIQRLSAHFEKCPFAQYQVAALKVLQRIAASDVTSWAFPMPDETPEQYALRVITRLSNGDSLELVGIAKLPEETDKDYLLRIILMGAKGE